ncbi:hypothetical protein BDA99DRAFT_571649 [Phascolomyces articulosus]|uniref:Uncharacterized protein n=1 Tax=Phascolomyces articulosus TaxID=60185 RepID=A0AAD5PE70_9FUNG|nr:hypothetical protein BDA99DRAFT_571643 [Phascolomyces articulosus]KAI9264168.1 hypothetical protein BDA99DRAFT_571649 [Phascolomyces articulosus]
MFLYQYRVLVVLSRFAINMAVVAIRGSFCRPDCVLFEASSSRYFLRRIQWHMCHKERVESPRKLGSSRQLWWMGNGSSGIKESVKVQEPFGMYVEYQNIMIDFSDGNKRIWIIYVCDDNISIFPNGKMELLFQIRRWTDLDIQLNRSIFFLIFHIHINWFLVPWRISIIASICIIKWRKKKTYSCEMITNVPHFTSYPTSTTYTRITSVTRTPESKTEDAQSIFCLSLIPLTIA